MEFSVLVVHSDKFSIRYSVLAERVHEAGVFMLTVPTAPSDPPPPTKLNHIHSQAHYGTSSPPSFFSRKRVPFCKKVTKETCRSTPEGFLLKNLWTISPVTGTAGITAAVIIMS